MRILMIHASEFSFHVTAETSVVAAAGEVSEEEKKGASGDALVCFLSIEKRDEDAPGRVVAEAHRRILEQYGRVGAETLWLYPYAHLSSNLANPRMAEGLDQMGEFIRYAGPDQFAGVRQMDGNGTPGDKLATWDALKQDAPDGLRFGWKNFYDEDTPTMSPESTMSNTPTPWWVSYQ